MMTASFCCFAEKHPLFTFGKCFARHAATAFAATILAVMTFAAAAFLRSNSKRKTSERTRKNLNVTNGHEDER